MRFPLKFQIIKIARIATNRSKLAFRRILIRYSSNFLIIQCLSKETNKPFAK